LAALSACACCHRRPHVSGKPTVPAPVVSLGHAASLYAERNSWVRALDRKNVDRRAVIGRKSRFRSLALGAALGSTGDGGDMGCRYGDVVGSVGMARQ